MAFRFDLGIAPLPGREHAARIRPPLFRGDRHADPELSDLKLVSEPGLRRPLPAQRFPPAKALGHLERPLSATICVALKGDDDCSLLMAERTERRPILRLYGGRPAAVGRAITFIHRPRRLHPGRSGQLQRAKHNLAQWRGQTVATATTTTTAGITGLEGPCNVLSTPITPAANRQQRNLTANPAARPGGMPMLLEWGDEVRPAGQGGNNNTWWPRNNPLGWTALRPRCRRIWPASVRADRLLVLRRQYSPACSTGAPLRARHAGPNQPSPPQPSGRRVARRRMERPDWGSWSHTLAWSYTAPSAERCSWCGLNAYSKAIHFDLPNRTRGWLRVIDTSLPAGQDLPLHPELWNPQRGPPLESRT